MAHANFRYEPGADGIAVLIWDMPERSMNVFTPEVLEELETIVETAAADGAVAGVIVVSGKEHFSGGADLRMVQGLLGRFHAERATLGEEAAARRLMEVSSRMSRIYRRLETAGKPWVAAIRGTCVGGAFELALACHARIAVDDARTRLGLPEVKVGLIPGAGGTQRVIRMVETQAALKMLLQGELHTAGKAKALGLVDALVPPDGDLIAAARARLRAGLSATKPWDEDGYRPPIKVYSPVGMQLFSAANAIYRRETFDNYPAARHILSCVYEGLQLPMDLALRVESRRFTAVMRTKEAAAMIRSLFVSMQELGKGARRPSAVPARPLRRIGVLGAGFMGAGIAHVTAVAGLEVVLIDRDEETAQKGKARAAAMLDRRIGRGSASPADREALIARIRATADYAELAGCDLVIEAVFEDRAVKQQATARAEAVIGASAIYASNTSTLPITSLATASSRPEKFIGIHFFSPVDRMKLVEVILGEKTSQEALAVALDYVRAIRKTPIVVNDSRGFYVNRCVTNYLLEAHLMLMEGVPPAMIENVARMAGMPVGPLALTDEVAVDLVWKILQATRKDLGEAAVDPRQEALIRAMVVEHGRYGRKNGKGFYDYPEQGRGRKRLWPGLADIAEPRPAEAFSVEELKRRLHAVQALEAARCVEEGVVTDVREADVGSILGYGFAPFTGGTLSYIDGLGARAFVAMCEELAARHGARFAPPALLKEMAERGETFYGRFPPGGAAGRPAA